MDEILLEIWKLIGTILGFALASFTLFLIKNISSSHRFDKKLKEIGVKKELSLLAVKFIEQKFKESNNQEKFDKASEWLFQVLSDSGIYVEEKEIEGLIEAALKSFKETYNKNK